MITDGVVAADTGGTFTDLVALDASGVVRAATKVSTTPQEPVDGIVTALAEIGVSKPDVFLYGTTTATNALLQRKGARTALITTKGFRDLLELRRQNRPSLYDWFAAKAHPLVPRELCFEIDERVAPARDACHPLDEEQARRVVEALRQHAVSSVAVSFLHSYRDDRHERRVAELLGELCPELDVSLSSDVLPEIMEFERTCTTAANAYVSPIMKEHLRQLVPRLRRAGVASPVFLMQSDGGLGSAAAMAERAVQTVLSGPAAGVMGGIAATSDSTKTSFLTIDMGGTSLDVSYVQDGRASMTRETTMDGLPLALPALDIHTLGAGGGSVAWVDGGGALRVGPASAGSQPGPACYGRGGELPTVTDANLLLGRLGTDLLGGRLELDVDRAARAVETHLARPLGVTAIEAAWGVLEVVNAAMTKGMHLMTVARGRDPRALAVVGFGGAGPLHACELATALGSDEVIVPPLPGTTSAIGLALASVRRERTQSVLTPLERLDTPTVERVLSDLAVRVVADLEQQGVAPAQVSLGAVARCSYEGQRYQLEVPVEPTGGGFAPSGGFVGGLGMAAALFESLHLAAYGYLRAEPLFVFSLGVVGTAPPSASRIGALHFSGIALAGNGPAPRRSAARTREVVFAGRRLTATVLHRSELARGEQVAGPAVIEQFDSTTVVPPGWTAAPERSGSLLVRATA